MTQVMPSCRMPGRQQPQHELAAVGVHRVAGVVPALVARDDGKVRRQQVDDLALALVAPLRAQYCYVHRHLSGLYSSLIRGLAIELHMITLDGDTLTLEDLAGDRRRCSAGRARRARPRRRSTRRARSSIGTPPATRRSTASTPASARWPRSRSRKTRSASCSATCCAATRPASTSRCRRARCAR